MQLRMARLCLDCEEVHDAQGCPACASETYVFLTRWVPAPERRRTPRPPPPEAEAYQQLVNPPARPALVGRFVGGGVLGLTAVGLLGWLWAGRERRGDAGGSGGRDGDAGERGSGVSGDRGDGGDGVDGG